MFHVWPVLSAEYFVQTLHSHIASCIHLPFPFHLKLRSRLISMTFKRVSYSQHGNAFHIAAGTARELYAMKPVVGSAHQHMPESHCNRSQLPFRSQCKVTSSRPSYFSSFTRCRLHANTQRDKYNYNCVESKFRSLKSNGPQVILAERLLQSNPNIRLPSSSEQKHL